MILSIIGVLLSLLNLFFYFKLKTFIKNKQKKTSTMIEDCYAISKASSELVKIHKRKTPIWSDQALALNHDITTDAVQ